MVKLKLNFRYCVALYCITMLYASLHELVHHFAGYIVCGDWGTKTFNSFETACEEDPISFLATFAGPVFSFIMMYVGAHYLKTGSTQLKKHLGFALIFAQMPAQRMIGPIMGFNDEYYAVWNLWGASTTNQVLTTIVVFAICISPLITAYKAIGNPKRALWFALYFLLLPYLLFGPFFVLFEFLMVTKGVLDQAVIGIGLLFVINEFVTIGLFLKFKKYLDPFYGKSQLNA